MGLLILPGVIVGGALLAVLIGWWATPRRRGRVIPMVRIGIAANAIDLHLWVQRLRSAGMKCKVVDLVVPPATGTAAFMAFSAELWVREKDEKEARELLGI